MFSLSELAGAIEGNSRVIEDFVAPTQALQMQPDARLAIGTNANIRPLLETGHQQLGTLLAIPAAYYERCRTSDPTLLASNVNHWLGQREIKERRMVRTLNGNIRAVLSDSYRRIDNHEVATVVLDILRRVPGLRIASCAITESRMYIKAVSTAVEAKVKGSKRGVGDVVQAGVVCTNSEIGLGSLGVHGFAEFLWCTNGMVRSKDGLRITHLGRKVDASIEGLLSDGTKRLEDEAVLSKVRDVINGAFNPTAFQRFMDSLGNATQEPITAPDIPAVVEALGSSTTLALNQTERNSVLRHLIEGGDLSKYGLVNAVTRTGQDADSYDRATELEAAGFKLLEMPGRDWQRLMSQPTKITVEARAA